MSYIHILSCFLRALLVSRTSLAAENLALRQQLAILDQTRPRPKLKDRDRLFWVVLARLWSGWRSALVIVRPETVIRWHRQGFRYYWRWKSRARAGRPRIARELRQLIQRMSRENPLWGAPRIQAELHFLGYDLSRATIAKYMHRSGTPPSPSWRSFLNNHMAEMAGADFFTVPTALFQVLYVWVILGHERRRIVHLNVTAHPTSAWVAQQLREAFPFDQAPRYLIRDRDGAYGDTFQRCAQSMGIREVLIAPRSPWQNPFAERLIGSIRRDCLDHVIVINATHLKRILGHYLAYYQVARCHRSLAGDAPVPRAVEPPERGRIVAIPHVGGLHHRYARAA
jgi:hypothetical protein